MERSKRRAIRGVVDSVSCYRRRGSNGGLYFGISSVPNPDCMARMGQDGARRRRAKAGNMPCHDSPAIDKASPMASCTRESAIMHGVGQSRAGPDGMEARDKRTKGGTQGQGPRAGRRDGRRDNAHSYPTIRVVGPPFSMERRHHDENTRSQVLFDKTILSNYTSLL